MTAQGPVAVCRDVDIHGRIARPSSASQCPPFPNDALHGTERGKHAKAPGPEAGLAL